MLVITPQVTIRKPLSDETGFDMLQPGNFFILILGSEISVTWDKGMRVYITLKETLRVIKCQFLLLLPSFSMHLQKYKRPFYGLVQLSLQMIIYSIWDIYMGSTIEVKKRKEKKHKCLVNHMIFLFLLNFLL